MLEEALRHAQVDADLILLGLPASLESRQRAADATFHLLWQTSLPVLLVPAGHGMGTARHSTAIE